MRPVQILLRRQQVVARIRATATTPLVHHGSQLGAPGFDPRWLGLGGWILPFQHHRARDGTLHLGDGTTIGDLHPSGPTVNVAARREQFTFDDRGRIVAVTGLGVPLPRLRTRYAHDHRVEYFDEHSAGWVVERTGPSTAVVIDPSTRTCTLELDGAGWLCRATDPFGRTWALEHDTDGRLQRLRDPWGAETTCAYEAGRLVQVCEPGLQTDVVVTEVDGGLRCALVRSTGEESSVTEHRLDDGTVRRVYRCCGTPAPVTVEQRQDGTRIATLADGTRIERWHEHRADDVWGVPIASVAHHRVVSPGGAARTTRRWTYESNGTVVEVIETDGSQRKRWLEPDANVVRTAEPSGRGGEVAIGDGGRTIVARTASGAVVELDHDEHGRLRRARQGPTTVTIEPAPDGAALSDGVRSTTVATSHDGRSVTQTLADGTELAISLLDDRNLAIVHDGVMIGRYHRGESGQESMVLAEVDGQTTWRTMHRDPLGRLVAIDEPHGRITVRRGADGTVQGWEGFGEAVELERDAAGRVQHVRASNGEETAFTRDGPRLLRVEQRGVTPGAVDLRWDSMRPTGYHVDGREVEWQRSPAGELAAVGPCTLERDPSTGSVTSRRTGVVEETFRYDEHRRLVEHRAMVGGEMVAERTVEYGASGQIARSRERYGDDEVDRRYDYDEAGRLCEVESGGVVTWQARHDRRGNRVELQRDGARLVASVDERDRLRSFGDERFTYDQADRIVAREAGGERSTYRYDAMGNLVEARLGSGTAVEHVVDGSGRRVATKVDGQLVRRYLWLGRRLVAVGHGEVANGWSHVFVHGPGRAPLGAIGAEGTYAFVTDGHGTVRMVIDASSGEIGCRRGVDPDGQVSDAGSLPWLVFGYAGGLHDDRTGLVQFGAREYDPSLGRFTRRDPALFGGGELNLHEYAGGDPVNRIDPRGTTSIPVPIDVSGGSGSGGGVYVCARDFMGFARHGAIGVQDPGGNNRIYGMVPGGPDVSDRMFTTWGDQTADMGNDPSLRCKVVPDVEYECIMGQIKNDDGSFRETGGYMFDPGMSDMSGGFGPNICWNPVFDAVRACGGDPYDSIPTDGAWESAMNGVYGAFDLGRSVNEGVFEVYGGIGSEVASWFSSD